jgi:SPP1 gp7 family putative phage head morphogenesis protein
MNLGAHKADVRIATKNALKIQAALRQGIDAKRVIAAYRRTSPNKSKNPTQDRARARAWALLNMRINNEPLLEILQRTWADGYALGMAYGDEQITRAREAKKAAQDYVDWDNWKPGDAATATLLRPPKAFQELLGRARVTIKDLDQTGYDRVGTALADSIEQGLSDTRAARLINDAIGSPARALTIAITETNRAMSYGAISRYKEANLEEMEWSTSDPCPTCAMNSGSKVIIGGTFPSGADMPPAHPHCRCVLLPVIPEFEPNENGVVDIAPKPEPTFAPVTDSGRKEYRRLLKDTDYDADAKYAAQRWQGEDYRRIQSGLSSGKLSNLSDDVREIVDILDDNMILLDDADNLYRGVTEGLDNLKIGDKFVSPLYQAATTDPITAAGFSKSSGSVLGGIKQGETATILRIDAFDAKGMVVPDSSEFEVILARGTKFEVEDISEEVINGVNMRIIDVTAVSK